jgi:hypothetical protein
VVSYATDFVRQGGKETGEKNEAAEKAVIL